MFIFDPMINIKYKDGTSQVIRPSEKFEATSENISRLVAHVGEHHPIDYYISDYGKSRKNQK